MKNAKTILPTARALVEKGHLDRALVEYEAHLRENPGDARVLQRIGDVHLRAANASAALDAYRRSAAAYVAQGFYAKACALYKQILSVAPGSIDAHIHLADLYLEFALHADARRQLEQAARLCTGGPDDPDLREVESRLAALRTRGDESDLIRTRKRAQTLLSHGRPSEAVAELRPCFDASPDDADTLELLAQALLAARKSARAVLVLHRLAFLAHEAGDLTRRDEIYARVLVVAPDDAEARLALGRPARATRPMASPQLTIVEEIVAD